jgi:hypothetical protein
MSVLVTVDDRVALNGVDLADEGRSREDNDP